MSQILVIVAIVGIGYLLYRSLVIKRQPQQDDAPVQQSAPKPAPGSPAPKVEADAKVQAAAQADAAAPTPTPTPVTPAPDTSTAPTPQAKAAEASAVASHNEVGAEANQEAQQAVAKAAEKAHMVAAEEATKSTLQQQASAGIASNQAPVAPEGAEAQAAALSETNDPLARHRLYQHIVEQSYRQRNDSRGEAALMFYAAAHIKEFDAIKGPLKKQNGGKLPQVATFKQYSAALTERGQYAQAIEVCEQAVKYKLKDGTKSGYEGRIERIKKLQDKQ